MRILLSVLFVLLGSNLAVGSVSDPGDTPLITAVKNGGLEAVEALLDMGADVNKFDNEGKTPLWWTAIRGHRDVAALLIKAGADVNKPDNYGNTPLHDAAAAGHKDLAELLIAAGADVNKADKYGSRPPLWLAVRYEHRELVELLIAAGADVNKVNKKIGNTLLHLAAWRGNKDLIELLIAAGADVNKVNKDGQTPFAVGWWNTDVAMILLDAKANPDLADYTNENYVKTIVFSPSGCSKETRSVSIPHQKSIRELLVCHQLEESETLIRNQLETNILDEFKREEDERVKMYDEFKRKKPQIVIEEETRAREQIDTESCLDETTQMFQDFEAKKSQILIREKTEMFRKVIIGAGLASLVLVEAAVAGYKYFTSEPEAVVEIPDGDILEVVDVGSDLVVMPDDVIDLVPVF